MDEPDELQEKTCVETQAAHRIATEQLWRYLNDRRNIAQQTRLNLLSLAKSMEREVAEYDALLAELTMG